MRHKASGLCRKRVHALKEYLDTFSAKAGRLMPHLMSIACSDVFNFAQKARGDVIYKAANSDSLRNPRVGMEFLELLTHIAFDVFERVEISGSNGGCTGPTVDSGTERLFVRIHQPPVGGIDVHDLIGLEQEERYEQGRKGML